MDIQSFINQVADGIVSMVYDKVAERLEEPIEDDLITTKRLCEMLDIEYTTLYKWEKEGLVHRVGSLGNKVYYSRNEIMKLITKNN